MMLWKCCTHYARKFGKQTIISKDKQLDEAHAGIKISGRNIDNLRYADDTTVIAESEEELRSLSRKVKKLG